MLAMTIRDRIADLLWRDRDGYDPTTGQVGDQRNVSALGWLRTKRHSAGGKLRKAGPWLIPTAVSTATAVAVPLYLDHRATEAGQQVNANTGELRLKCVQQPDGILACVNADNQVVTGADGQSLRPSGAGLSGARP